MSLDSYVCFVVKGQPTINEPYNDLVNMKTSEILSKMKYDSEYLYIRTPFFIKPLQMDSFPIKDFKNLAVSKKYLKYNRPEYYLTIEPSLNNIEICVTPKIKPNYEIPPFFTKFSMNELSKMTAFDVKNTIQQQLGFEVNSSKLYFLDSKENEDQKQNDQENISRTESTESIDSIDILVENHIIPDEYSAQNLIDEAQTKTLFIYFDLPDGTISKIKKRVNILAEIISTEKTYINDLTIINDHWKPGIQEFLTPDDFQIVFKDISAIKSCHQSFLTDLEAAGSRYDSKVAIPFIEFSNFFKVSQQYIANYNTINDILIKYEKKKKMKQQMLEIAKSLDGRDLYSYLITPVQRMPRYLLFLRDLLKVTVQSHPDSELLPVAYESIDEVTKRIDKSTETSKNQQNLMKLQKLITNFTFLDKQRNLLTTIKISIIEGNTSKNGEILVFDDLLVVIKKGKTLSKAIFDSPIQRFHFQSQRPDNLSITVDSTNMKYLSSSHRKSKQKDSELLYGLRFDNNEEMQKFFEEIEKLQEMELFKFEKLSNQYIFKWNHTLLQVPLPDIYSPATSAFEGSLLIISCKNVNQTSLSCTPEIYRVALSNKTIFKAETKFPSLKLPLSTAMYKKILYFINDDKFYKYDPKKNKLTNIQATFTPRVAHSSVFCGDNLMIFGGKSTSTNKMLNDLIVYNVARDVLMIVNPNETTPKPRINHCSFGYKDKLYIFGGETADGSISNDLYSYELESASWTKVQTTGDQLIHRKNGKAVLSGHYAILIGGEVSNRKDGNSNLENETNNYINQPQIYNLKKKIVYTVENFGNVPDYLTSFDAVFSPNNNYSLCLITPNNLYNITTPAILQKSTSSKHFDEADEAKRRTSTEVHSLFPFSSTTSKKSHHRSQSPHAVTKKQKKQDRNSLSFEQFNLNKEADIDIHEKPLNDQETLLLEETEDANKVYTHVSEEYSEAESEDLPKYKHHRKRGKTNVPLPPKSKTASAQSSQERFIDLVPNNYEFELDGKRKVELSICNAFPESLQTLRDDKEIEKEDEKNINNKEFEKKENKTIQVERNPSPKKIEEVMNISLFDKNEKKENNSIQVEHKTSPKKIEKVVNISLFDENKNENILKERSFNIQNNIEKTIDISFSFENQQIDNKTEHHHHHHKKESKTIQVENLTPPKSIEKVMKVSQFYENNEKINDNNNNDNQTQNLNQNTEVILYNNDRRNSDNLMMNENMVFEVEEEVHEKEKSEIPVVAIAATAAISVLLTAGTFFVFNRMRK